MFSVPINVVGEGSRLMPSPHTYSFLGVLSHLFHLKFPYINILCDLENLSKWKDNACKWHSAKHWDSVGERDVNTADRVRLLIVIIVQA